MARQPVTEPLTSDDTWIMWELTNVEWGTYRAGDYVDAVATLTRMRTFGSTVAAVTALEAQQQRAVTA